jgi:hypothetical protein
MQLRDIKLIDLRRSKLKRGSDPKKGIYKFEPNGKIYVSWKDPATRPPDYVKWNRNTPYDVERWRTLWNYSEVTIGDPYWPEGVRPNEDGHYVYSTDMILMKCPLENYIEKRKKEIMKSELASIAKLKEFENTAKRLGTTVEKQVAERVYGEL